MATKLRIGMRLYNPYVPNEVWDLFKKTLRKTLKKEIPELKIGVTEYYWSGFSTCDEYIRLTAPEVISAQWESIIAVTQHVANAFHMNIRSIYSDDTNDIFTNYLKCMSRLQSRYVSLILENAKKDWTKEELDSFLQNHNA